MNKPVALAADHGGFELKEAVNAHLEEQGKLKNGFTSKFRKRPDWELSVDLK